MSTLDIQYIPAFGRLTLTVGVKSISIVALVPFLILHGSPSSASAHGMTRIS